jgi:hypothetical protein
MPFIIFLEKMTRFNNKIRKQIPEYEDFFSPTFLITSYTTSIKKIYKVSTAILLFLMFSVYFSNRFSNDNQIFRSLLQILIVVTSLSFNFSFALHVFFEIPYTHFYFFGIDFCFSIFSIIGFFFISDSMPTLILVNSFIWELFYQLFLYTYGMTSVIIFFYLQSVMFSWL